MCVHLYAHIRVYVCMCLCVCVCVCVCARACARELVLRNGDSFRLISFTHNACTPSLCLLHNCNETKSETRQPPFHFPFRTLSGMNSLPPTPPPPPPPPPGLPCRPGRTSLEGPSGRGLGVLPIPGISNLESPPEPPDRAWTFTHGERENRGSIVIPLPHHTSYRNL
jgi:hypothetical protein